MRRTISRAALDGCLHALLLILLIEVVSSTWAARWTLEGCLLLTLAAALISVVAYVFNLRRAERVTAITLRSILFCLLTLGASFFRLVGLHWRFLPAREGNAGDGLLLLLLTGLYLLLAGMLRVVVWIELAESSRFRALQGVARN